MAYGHSSKKSQREPKEYNRDERCYLINRETDEINIRLSHTLSEDNRKQTNTNMTVKSLILAQDER